MCTHILRFYQQGRSAPLPHHPTKTLSCPCLRCLLPKLAQSNLFATCFDCFFCCCCCCNDSPSYTLPRSSSSCCCCCCCSCPAELVLPIANWDRLPPVSVANVYCAFRLHFTFLPYTAAMAINCCCTYIRIHSHTHAHTQKTRTLLLLLFILRALFCGQGVGVQNSSTRLPRCLCPPASFSSTSFLLCHCISSLPRLPACSLI